MCVRRENLRTVIYSCNDAYIKQTIVSIVSLLKTNPYPMDILVISDELSQGNKRIINEKMKEYGQAVKFLEFIELTKKIEKNEKERHPRTIYAKLFLESQVHEGKVIYLDSDTVVLGNLEELWQRDMSNEYVAGVQMPYSAKIKKNLGIDENGAYLCDGIVVLNLELWKRDHLGEKCIEYIERYQGNPPMLSEGTLNYVCQKKIGILQPSYNVMPQMFFYKGDQIKKLFEATDVYYHAEMLEEAKKAPIIVHYINELYSRPWQEPCDHPMKDEYRNLYKKVFQIDSYEKKHIDFHIRFIKFCYKVLPFTLYCKLYQIRQRVKVVIK